VAVLDMEIFGAFLALIGGITNGLYPTPKNKMKLWGDSHVWSVFALFTFLLIPLIILFTNLNEFTLLSVKSIEVLAAGGLFFSIGMICFTLSLKKIGLGPSFSLNIILSTSLGTLIPLFIFHSNQIASTSALFIYVGIALFVISIILLSSSLSSSSDLIRKKDKMLGIILGIVSGVLTSVQSSAYNYAINDLNSADLTLLVNKLTVWSIFFIGSFFVFFLFHFIRSSKELNKFNSQKLNNVKLIAAMAIMYYLSIALFSWATNYIAVPIAWPIFMTSIVLTTNFWSNKNKELAGFRKKRYQMYLATTLLAFIFFALSMHYGN
jgi:L-rhamnose-H+ transport protein